MRISTDVAIAAPRDRVWQILSRFEDYHRWNPLCRDMQGRCAQGEQIRFRLSLGGMRVPVTCEVLSAVPGEELRWIGPGTPWARKVASGEHFFVLHDDGAGTRVEHGELFRGALGLGRYVGGERLLTPAYEALNRALKKEAETTSIARG
jgi:hypothetical protein